MLVALLAALGAAVLMLSGAPPPVAAADVDRSREALAPTDGWAAATSGTPGGAYNATHDPEIADGNSWAPMLFGSLFDRRRAVAGPGRSRPNTLSQASK